MKEDVADKEITEHPPFAPEEAPQVLAGLVGREAEVVKQTIMEKYGFFVTDQYAQDFVAFVESLTNARE